MPRRVGGNPTTPAIRTDRPETPPQPRTPERPPERANVGWSPVAGTRPGRARYPEVATAAKGFVDAYANASKARSQMEMVAGSVDINHAADALLKRTAEELASQLADRGQDAKSDQVLADLDRFNTQIGPPRGYRMDPERGTMASLEDNGERMDKVMAKLASVAKELGKVNKEPIGEFQQAYNRQAAGEAIMNEALFAGAFQKAYDKNGDDQVIKDAQTFFKGLPKKVDSQDESRGGSLEPLERSGATSAALIDMTKKFSEE